MKKALRELFDILDKRLNEKEDKEDIATRIKWNGQFIKTAKGKNVWKKIGDAKLAFRFEIWDDVMRVLQSNLGRYPSREEQDAFYNLIVESGNVEFVPLE